MKFFRVSEPDVSSVPRPLPTVLSDEGSAAQQSVWRAIWQWYQGGIASVTEADSPSPTVGEVLGSSVEMVRVGDCYRMAQHAAAGSASALMQLQELLLCTQTPVAQRAAMYGLASTGNAAVPCLLAVLRGVTAGGREGVFEPMAGEDLNTAVRCVFALGEAATPTGDLLDLLGDLLLPQWMGNLRECIADSPSLPADGKIGAVAAWHRAVAVCVHALGVLAERAIDEPTALRIAKLLLPLTLELDPIGGCGMDLSLAFTGSGCAAWWISEGAAIGLLRVVSSAAGRHQTAVQCRGGVVKRLSPAEQNDQRYVQALGMLALQRSLAATAPDRSSHKQSTTTAVASFTVQGHP